MAAAFSDIQQRVRYAVKMTAAGDTIPQLIKDAINMAYLDIVVEMKPNEFLFPQKEYAATARTGMEPDFIEVETITFLDFSTSREHRLLPRNGIVPPAPIFGLPRWYHLHGSNNPASPNISQVEIGPFTATVDQANDKIRVTYLFVPVRLVADGDTIRSTWLHNEIEKRAIHFLLTYANDIQKAQEILAMSLKRMTQSQSAQ